MAGTYQCFHCLSDSVIWDNDFDFSDFGYEGEGVVHICHCANCGAEIEYRVANQTDEEDTNDEIIATMCDNCLPQQVYTHCLRCGKALISEKSKLKGYGKICERKAKYESKLKLF